MKASTVANACKLLLIASLGFSASAMAAEQWSNDLWTEQPNEGGSTGDGSQQDTQPGTGLWSDELWSEPSTGIEPAPPPPAEEPLPIEAPDPVAEPEPAAPKPEIPAPVIPDPANTITMQIGHSTATVRGETIELATPPFTINGRAMIPLRFIGEALQATVQWDAAEQKVTMELNGKQAQLWVNRSTAMKDGQAVQLDFPPMVLNGVTLVPLRFVGEFFGYQVNFDHATQTITIVDQGSAAPPEPVPPKPEQPEPEQPKPLPGDMGYNYFGTWDLRADGRTGGQLMGRLIVNDDGAYGIATAVNGIVTGFWRPAAADEVIGHKNALILENGPNDADWVILPKTDDLVSVRYHYGYSGETKIWFEYSLGIRAEQ